MDFNLDLHILGAIFWVVMAVIFAIIEGFTLGLATIWFAIGSVAAAISAWFEAPIYMQVIIFLLVSLGVMFITKPFAKKALKIGHYKDITESLVGKEILISSGITPIEAGQAVVNGIEWRVVSEDEDMTIENGSKVKIVKVEGVKLIVKPLKKKEAIIEE